MRRVAWGKFSDQTCKFWNTAFPDLLEFSYIATPVYKDGDGLQLHDMKWFSNQLTVSAIYLYTAVINCVFIIETNFNAWNFKVTGSIKFEGREVQQLLSMYDYHA